MDSIKILLAWSTPPIGQLQERLLLVKAKQGCQQSRETLVRTQVRFAIKRAKNFSGKGYTLEDYVQFGIIGIMRAIDSFDMSRKTRLTTHVSWIMRHEIMEARRKGEIIRCPNKKHPKNMVDLFDLPGREEPEEPDRDLWFMPYLSKKERLIASRFLNGETLDVIGKLLGVTRERVRQIQMKLFERIRDAQSRSKDNRVRGRILVQSRWTRSSPKKSRKNRVLSCSEQVDQCFAN